MNLRLSDISLYNDELTRLPSGKLLINTINAHCYNIAQKDKIYTNALNSSDVLLPDGISIIFAKNLLNSMRLKKIAGADLFFYEMERLNKTGGKCFFLGSNTDILQRITEKANNLYPNVKVETYSPPYVPEFSKYENEKMIQLVNKNNPDVLFIGMTAPKQEKWAYLNYNNLNVGHICNIGAVFDFFAGNIRRAPKWMINLGMEWLYRLYKEPFRLWRRYLLGNILFIFYIFKEKFVSGTINV